MRGLANLGNGVVLLLMLVACDAGDAARAEGEDVGSAAGQGDAPSHPGLPDADGTGPWILTNGHGDPTEVTWRRASTLEVVHVPLTVEMEQLPGVLPRDSDAMEGEVRLVTMSADHVLVSVQGHGYWYANEGYSFELERVDDRLEVVAVGAASHSDIYLGDIWADDVTGTITIDDAELPRALTFDIATPQRARGAIPLDFTDLRDEATWSSAFFKRACEERRR